MEVVERLRAPDGCPWDRAQTLETLGHFLIEEAYEVREVMAGEDPALHQEELGDLLFQIVLQTELRRERGAFSLAPVIEGITRKLVRRHPHVFGDEVVSRADEVPLRWEAIKRAEGKGKGTLADVPRALPALMRAEKIGARAARAGFDWPDVRGPLGKLDEEVGELREALAEGDPAHVKHELGDVLFAAVNVARHAGVHPEEALAATNERFLRRYAHVETRLAETGRAPEDASLDELNDLWDEAKRRHGG